MNSIVVKTFVGAAFNNLFKNFYFGDIKSDVITPIFTWGSALIVSEQLTVPLDLYNAIYGQNEIILNLKSFYFLSQRLLQSFKNLNNILQAILNIFLVPFKHALAGIIPLVASITSLNEVISK